MTSSFIAIRGNHLDRSNEILGPFGYVDTHKDQHFTDWQSFTDYLLDNYYELANDQIIIRGMWVADGWTILLDPELVDRLEEEALLGLSGKLYADIVTFDILPSSDTFGFTLYNGTIQRIFLASNGEITYDLYQPLSEEQGLNINEKVSSEDIVALARRLGIDLEGGKSQKTYVVKQLAYNEEKKKELKKYEQHSNAPTNSQKPWWKLW